MYFLILVSIIWAFSFPLFKTYVADLDNNFSAWARMIIALPAFIPFLRTKKLNGKLMLNLIVVGAVQYGIMYSALNYSYQFLQAHEVALSTIFTPIYVTLINDAYNRRFNLIYLIMALIAVAGAGVILFSKDRLIEDAMTGFLIMQVSNLCFAFGQIEYRRIRAANPSLRDSQIYAFLYLGAVIITSLATTATGGWSHLTTLKMNQFFVLIYLGIVASGLCFYLWNKGATISNPGTLAILNNLKIPLAVVCSMLLFRERASSGMIQLLMGATLMILATGFAEWYARREEIRRETSNG